MTVLAARFAALLRRGSGAAQVAPVYFRHDLRQLSSHSPFDVEVVANNPGTWALYRHIVHHTTNNDLGVGGLLMLANVRP